MSENETRRHSDPADVGLTYSEGISQVTEIDFVDLLAHLLEKAKYIVLAVILGALVAGIYTFLFTTPVYEATSKLYVMNSQDSAINLSDLQVGSYLANDYLEVFSTWELHEMVIDNLDLPYSYAKMRKMLSVSNPNDTRILYISVNSTSAEEAAQIANEYAKMAQRFISEVMRSDEPSVFSEALVPVVPVSPNITKNIIMGFLIGMVLSVGLFALQFIMDDKIKSADDIRKYVNVPTLAIVPSYKPETANAEKNAR